VRREHRANSDVDDQQGKNCGQTPAGVFVEFKAVQRKAPERTFGAIANADARLL
jgi:hypothetical protein